MSILGSTTAIDLLLRIKMQEGLPRLQNHSIGTGVSFGVNMLGYLFVTYNTPIHHCWRFWRLEESSKGRYMRSAARYRQID
jgi:hypothetical protein